MVIEIIVGLLFVFAFGVWLFLNSLSFGSLPKGERLIRVRNSPNYRDGAFQNLDSTKLMVGEKNRWETLYEVLFKKVDGLRPDKPIEAVKTDLSALPRDSDLFVWFGHSSYLLQLGGVRFLVDPVLYSAAPVSFVNRAFPGTDIYKADDIPDVDYLIISHDHWDHLDCEAVTRLRPRVGKVILPLGVGEHFERWGYAPADLIELDWWERRDPAEGFTLHCLPARHFSGRGLTGNQSLWASYMLEIGGKRVFVGGDSGYGRHFKMIAERFRHIDLAILENGQYNDDWRYIHTMPDRLIDEVRELASRSVITVHHSKFALARHPWDEPLRNEQRIAAETDARLLVAKIGEVLLIKAGSINAGSRHK